MTRRSALLALFAGLLLFQASPALGQSGGELRFCLRADPKTLNPLLATDESSETVRYLTGGVLIRLNRKTQALEPELATSWKVTGGGRKITFTLRQGVTFSDGTPFSAEDVAFTFRKLMDPALNSPIADSFRSSSGEVKAEVSGLHQVAVTFPAPVAGLERLFDQVVILSARSPKKEGAVLGAFVLAEHRPGAYLLLQRNPRYWKRDAAERRLPYLDSIRLEIQQNRDIELVRFRRGEVHLINNVDPTMFDQLSGEQPGATRDAGPTLESEMLWFNQVPAAPIPDHKKQWFRSRAFRRAISAAINRQDLVRVVYQGRASAGVGPASPSNQFWFNQSLKPHAFDPQGALRALEKEGFRREGGVLRDAQGQPVEFSLITNAGNKAREQIAAMIQQDLTKVGIRLNIVTLDFPSLIERMTRTYNYEACLLGLVNVDLDPNGQMNVWLSSAGQHIWNPNQESPATEWEAEIDRLMQAQASVMEVKQRKAHFDRVQEIVWEEAPILYLVNRNGLSAVSTSVHQAEPVILWPQTFWNAERLTVNSNQARSHQ
ncbi:MAG: ABC transporter substrate-binding protein [Candidatus Acidiferrales bacterium]